MIIFLVSALSHSSCCENLQKFKRSTVCNEYNKYPSARFEVFAAVTMNITVTPCSPVPCYQHLGEVCHIQLSVPCRWRRHVPSQRWQGATKSHGVTSSTSG